MPVLNASWSPPTNGGRKPFFEFDKRVRHIDLGINYEANKAADSSTN